MPLERNIWERNILAEILNDVAYRANLKLSRLAQRKGFKGQCDENYRQLEIFCLKYDVSL